MCIRDRDGNAALALLVVAVQHALVNLLVLAEHAAGVQQAVDDGGLAVVNVRDNGDVADVLLLHAFLLLSIQAMPKSARR